MKRRITIICSLLLAAFSGLFAQEVFHDLDFDVQKADVSAVDYDGDGDLDILIIGENPDGFFAQLFQNNGEMQFEKVESPFAPSAITSVDYGDVDGDGYLDAIQSGFADSVITNLYTSDGEGNWSLDPFSNDIIHIAPSAGVADLNNDGHADLYVFGNHNIEDSRPKLYFGDGAGGFTEESPFDNYKWIDNEVSEVDIDNDGDLDLWVMAGYEEGIDARFARLFENDNGTFTETDPEIVAKGPGYSDWGDYDGDGDFDLLINGYGYVNSGEDNDMIYRIYENTNGALTEAAVFEPYGQFGPTDGSRFADWDNDGDLDVILTGWNPDEEAQRTAVFLNNSGTFTAAEYNASLPGVSESAVEVADLDDDGDLDLIINGFSGNNFDGEGSAYGRNISLIIENTTAETNEAPSAPGNLQAVSSGSSVTFSWDEASDDKTASASLTYNLFLVDANGQYYYYPLADTASGKLIVSEKGNVQLNKEWTVKGLPYGEYRWGVQAIDNSFTGSTFTATDFTHTEGDDLLSTIDYNLKPLVYPNPSKGELNVHVTKDVQSFSVVSLDGKLVRNFVNKGVEEILQINLKEGIYVLQAIYADGHLTTHKLIVN